MIFHDLIDFPLGLHFGLYVSHGYSRPVKVLRRNVNKRANMRNSWGGVTGSERLAHTDG